MPNPVANALLDGLGFIALSFLSVVATVYMVVIYLSLSYWEIFDRTLNILLTYLLTFSVIQCIINNPRGIFARSCALIFYLGAILWVIFERIPQVLYLSVFPGILVSYPAIILSEEDNQ